MSNVLPLSLLVNVSVSQPPVGIGAFNVNNLAIFTTETPINPYLVDSFGNYVSLQEVANDWGTYSEAYAQANMVFSQQPNILAGNGSLIIFPMNGGETLAQAITRCTPLIYFCGILSNDYPASGSMLALAEQISGNLLQMLFLPSYTFSDLAGAFTSIENASLNQTRCLFRTDTALNARLFAAAYAGRGMSVNFEGSNTALTMQAKQLTGVTLDPGMTQTIFTDAQLAGADVYANIAGLPMVWSNGGNNYFDSVYNLIWFIGAVQVAVANSLIQTGTKIPMTEPGMSYIKSVLRSVCAQGVNNGYLAPGPWVSPDWFGNQTDFINNIANVGYYIYSQPINQYVVQDPTQATKRIAPLCQIAISQSAAIHSSSIIININP